MLHLQQQKGEPATRSAQCRYPTISAELVIRHQDSLKNPNERITLSRSNETVSLTCIKGAAPATSSLNRQKVRVIASCFGETLASALPCCVDNVTGSEATGSGALPTLGSHKLMIEDVAIGDEERTRQQSVPGGGGTCKGLYAFS
jgi:hypothetical protein